MVTIRWSVHCTNIYGIKSRGIKIDEEACDVYMVGGGGGRDLVSAVYKNCSKKKNISISKTTSSLMEKWLMNVGLASSERFLLNPILY